MDEIEFISVQAVIQEAEQVLPGKPAEDGLDPRSRAIFELGQYVETEPEAIWKFIRTWGCYPDEDLQSVVSCCLLEPLLETHFTLMFPRVEQLALCDHAFAGTFLRCEKYRQSDEPANSAKFDSLRKRLGANSPTIGTTES